MNCIQNSTPMDTDTTKESKNGRHNTGARTTAEGGGEAQKTESRGPLKGSRSTSSIEGRGKTVPNNQDHGL